MKMERKDWIEAVKTVTKEDIDCLHPCFVYCSKWKECNGTECESDSGIMVNAWYGKIIANNWLW
jgi:hypothetical protein